MSGPITKVVKNDTYTAPRAPVPVAPTRPTPSPAAFRSSSAALKPVSRTLQQAPAVVSPPPAAPPQVSIHMCNYSLKGYDVCLIRQWGTTSCTCSQRLVCFTLCSAGCQSFRGNQDHSQQPSPPRHRGGHSGEKPADNLSTAYKLLSSNMRSPSLF